MQEAPTIKLRYGFIIPAFLLLLFMQACYYDNEESLYPGEVTCDTLNVTYSTTVAPILEASCVSCHNSQIAKGQVVLDNYTDLMKSVEDGSFRGSINHDPAFKPMPENRNKLSDCKLSKIDIWLREGASNN